MESRVPQVQPHQSYGNRGDESLRFDLYQPADPRGAAVLFVNSGGFESGKLRQYEMAGSSCRFLGPDELTVEDSGPIPALGQFSFADLLAAGITVFDVQHRNAPHKVDDMLEDIRSAIEHVHQRAVRYGIDADRIGVFGASSGGYLALAAGLTARRRHSLTPLARAIATYYPAGFDFLEDIAAFPQIRDGLPALAVDDTVLLSLSIKSLYPGGGPPTLIVYGDRDFPFIVNPCQSMCRHFPDAGIETHCVVIEGTAHEFMRDEGYRPADGHRARREVADWFTRHLLA